MKKKLVIKFVTNQKNDKLKINYNNLIKELNYYINNVSKN